MWLVVYAVVDVSALGAQGPLNVLARRDCLARLWLQGHYLDSRCVSLRMQNQ